MAALNRADFPPVLCIYPTQDLARYSDFTRSIAGLQLPPGSRLKYGKGVNVVGNFNRLLEEAYRDRVEFEYVWMIGDDHTFDGDVVLRLLQHQKDIVAPLVVRRGPFTPVAFHYRGEQPYPDYRGEVMPWWDCYTWEEIEQLGPGLHQVDAVGSAGMLVSRAVLDTLNKEDWPWFQAINGWHLNEDLLFCKRAAEHGFQTWLDCDTVIGHMGQFNVLPYWDHDGRVHMYLEFPGAESVVLESRTRVEVTMDNHKIEIAKG